MAWGHDASLEFDVQVEGYRSLSVEMLQERDEQVGSGQPRSSMSWRMSPTPWTGQYGRRVRRGGRCRCRVAGHGCPPLLLGQTRHARPPRRELPMRRWRCDMRPVRPPAGSFGSSSLACGFSRDGCSYRSQGSNSGRSARWPIASGPSASGRLHLGDEFIALDCRFSVVPANATPQVGTHPRSGRS